VDVLLGRRMHEVMSFLTPSRRLWMSEPTSRSSVRFGGPQTRSSIRVPAGCGTSRTRLRAELRSRDRTAIKEAAARDLSVAGRPGRTSLPIRSVDECHFFLPHPIGGGRNALPLDLRVRLELLAQHRFRSGAAYLHYRVALWAPSEPGGGRGPGTGKPDCRRTSTVAAGIG